MIKNNLEKSIFIIFESWIFVSEDDFTGNVLLFHPTFQRICNSTTEHPRTIIPTFANNTTHYELLLGSHHISTGHIAST